MKIARYTLLCLFFATMSLAPFVLASAFAADQWNQVFDQPRYFKVVRAVHLRARPSTNSAIVVTLKPGAPLRTTAIVNGWHKGTTADGKTGYVYKRFLQHLSKMPMEFASAPPASDTQTPAPPAPEPEPAPAPEPEPEPAPEPAPAPEPEPAPTPEPEPAAPVIDDEPLVSPEPEPATPEPPKPAPEPQPQTSEIQTTPVPEPATPEVTAPAVPEETIDTEGADCKRIKFQPGATSGSVERNLAAGEQHCYQLAVSQNQWMEVWLTSALDNAVFQIFSPAGVSITAQETHWLGRTEATGDYLIIVSAMEGGEAAYNLKVQVK